MTTSPSLSQIESPTIVTAIEGLRLANQNTTKTENAGDFGQHSVAELRKKSALLEHRVERLIRFFEALAELKKNRKGALHS